MKSARNDSTAAILNFGSVNKTKMRISAPLLWHSGLLLLLMLAADIEANPGPYTPKYPCGVCSKAVKWTQKGVACDSCDSWYHSSCVGLSETVYNSLSPEISWICYKCGLPNFSSDLFTSVPAESLHISHPSLFGISHSSSVENENDNSVQIEGSPMFTSSPKDGRNNSLESTATSLTSSNLSSSEPAYPIKNNASTRILIINFQSIRPKVAEFWNLISCTNPDIVIGSETWLKPEIYNAEILPDGYDLYRKDRADGYGGVLIATKKNLITQEISLESNAEAVLVRIESEKKQEPIVVGSFYRSPSKTSEQQITDIETAIDSAAAYSKSSTLWMGGDMNLPDINWETNSISGNSCVKTLNQRIINKVNDLGLEQLVDKPTRDDAILDLFFSNKPDLVTRTLVIPGLSDHDIVLVDSRIKPTRARPVARKVNVWKKANIDQMRHDTVVFAENFCNKYRTSEEMENMWSELQTHLADIQEAHIPTTTTRTKFHQPWISPQLRRLARRKQRAWKKAKESGDVRDQERYNKIKQETKKTNRNTYKAYVNNMISDDKDTKQLWKYIKSRKTDTTGVAPLSTSGISFSDSKAKSDILNEQFCSVFTEEDLSNIPSLDQCQCPAMPDIVVTEAGVTSLLKKINPKKACGPDNIPGRLLQLLSQELSPIITLLFNRSLQTGEIPRIWKHALVQPLFKKGDRSRATNYRPISLTSICCKLLEHIVRSAITKHLEAHNLLSDGQHGFRKQRSCETQLIMTIDDLASTIDATKQTDLILLDFSKAFDRVPHQRLLRKLAHYGVTGKPLAWIESFLMNRSQEVVVEGERSEKGAVTSGVPQGSVLGPTLFLVYINDLSADISSNVRLFADDTIVYRPITTPADTDLLQSDIDKLGSWEKTWQMGFNVEKCNSLTVTLRKKPIVQHYVLNNKSLERVSSAKYLGVTLTSNLNWAKHVKAITAKANKTSAFVYRNLKGCPAKVHTTCYKTLVRPVLEYASSVWSPHQKNLIQDLEMVQRRAARRICKDFSRETSATALVKSLGLETLKSRRDTGRAIMMYKVMEGSVCVNPRPGVITPTPRDTRTKHGLQLPHTRTNIMLHSFFPQAIRMWNSIPTIATEAPSADAFRNALKGWRYEN